MPTLTMSAFRGEGDIPSSLANVRSRPEADIPKIDGRTLRAWAELQNY